MSISAQQGQAIRSVCAAQWSFQIPCQLPGGTCQHPNSNQCTISKQAGQRGGSYIELFSQKRTSANPHCICLHHAYRLPNHFGWDAEPHAQPADTGGGQSYKGVHAEVDIKHESIGALDKHVPPRQYSIANIYHAVDDAGPEPFRKSLSII